MPTALCRRENISLNSTERTKSLKDQTKIEIHSKIQDKDEVDISNQDERPYIIGPPTVQGKIASKHNTS